MIDNDKNDIDTKKEEDDNFVKPVETSSDPIKDSDDLPSIEEVAPSTEHAVLAKGTLNKRGFKGFIATKKGKVILGASLLLVILAILYAIPATRYGIVGTFVKKDVHVVVKDASTAKPVSKATVAINGQEAVTDGDGKATIQQVPVGEYTLSVTKNYYKNSEAAYTVPIFESPSEDTQQIVATGRQVGVVVTNKITGAPVARAVVSVNDTSATTDSKGMATIVLPADKKTLTGTVTLDGYNQVTATITIADTIDANKVALTPTGTLFYLSKQTGVINVMKSDLDGSNAKVVVEGTGNEIDSSTLLLAARDWKYLVLSAKRDSTKVAQLYLVDAATGKLSVIDEGDASFQLVGWSGHRFIYQVNRNDKKPWDDKQQSLKSFDAETGKITTLDETVGSGTSYETLQAEYISSTYILEGKIVYAKTWGIGSLAPKDKMSAIMSVNPDGGNKQRVKEFPAPAQYISIEGKLYEPQAVYFRVSIDGGVSSYYEYEDGSVNPATSNDDKFYNSFYPTYLVSPTGKKTLWYEPRDGKNALFIGDKDAKNANEIAQQSDYVVYGWYSDDYVLLSKNESELYIVPAGKKITDVTPLKVTNYHKPTVKLPGYGYGYGGQ
jgi:hypothetical protein